MKIYILRHILLLFAVVATSYAQAQIESAPLIPMNSTSAMTGSGSTIPLAAETGAFAYDENIVTISRAPAAGPRRVGWDDDDPLDLVPIGSLPFLLMLLLCGGYVVVKKRKQAKLARFL